MRLADASLGPEDGAAPVGLDTGSDVSLDPDALTDGAAAAPDAPAQLCGNGMFDPGEYCDDGNTLPGDGCSSRCRIEDGPPCPGGTCVATAVCGNGVLTANEVCDDGNAASGDGCSADCQSVEAGWRCRVPGRPCVPICGDFAVKGSEDCDDGNTFDGDGCSVYCLTEPGWDCGSGVCVQVSPIDGGIDSGVAALCCGDGISSGAEECDEGESNQDDAYGGCTTKCFFGPFCGDGMVNGPEACDLGELNGKVLGRGGCTLGCTNPHYCGDGLVDPDEACDLADLNGVKLDADGKPTDDPAGMVFCTTDCAIPPWRVY
jgi:cysteine-rich repeat protein